MKVTINEPNPLASTSDITPTPFLPPQYINPSPNVPFTWIAGLSRENTHVPPPQLPIDSGSKIKEEVPSSEYGWIHQVCLLAQHMIKFYNHLHWTLDSKTDKMMRLIKVLSNTVIEQQMNMEIMVQPMNSLKHHMDGGHEEVMKKVKEVVEEVVVAEHNYSFILSKILFLLKEHELLAFVSFYFLFFLFIL